MKHLQFEHPHCEAPNSINLGKEYFVQIANPLLGRKEYNDLVLSYQKASWEEFEAQEKAFRETYPDNPLIEAVDFLSLQVSLERSSEKKEREENERRLQELLIRYPESEMIPIILGSAANHWNLAGQYEKALGIYERLRRDYRTHDSYCSFLMGLVESNYYIRNFRRMKTHIEEIKKICQNRRIRAGAEVRLADSLWYSDVKAAEKGYEKVINGYLSSFTKHYPAALYNLSEIKYRKKNYSAANVYLKQFVVQDKRIQACEAHALKRLADIRFKRGENLKSVVGSYLVVHQKYPTTEPGRYSQAQSLLLDWPTDNLPERERRLKLIDELIENTKEVPFKQALFLHKGMRLLYEGESRALDYMIRLYKVRDFRLRSEQVNGEVKAKLIEFMLRKVKDKFPSDIRSFLSMYDKAYPLWIQRDPIEKEISQNYSYILINNIKNNLWPKRFVTAMETFDELHVSPLYVARGIRSEQKDEFAFALMRSLIYGKFPRRMASNYLKYKKQLDPIIPLDLGFFWSGVEQLEKESSKKKSERGDRSLASLPRKNLPQDIKDYYWYLKGKIYYEKGQYPPAEMAFVKIRSKTFKKRTRPLQQRMLIFSKRYAKAFDFGVKYLNDLEGTPRKNQYRLLYSVVRDGKLWAHSERFLKLADSMEFREQELASYYYLAGKAAYTLKIYQRAVDRFSKAIELSPDAKESAEASFKLGKSLFQLGKREEAKKIWLELIEKNESQWSPLAKNEIQLMNQGVKP